jgi:hypothetical protein
MEEGKRCNLKAQQKMLNSPNIETETNPGTGDLEQQTGPVKNISMSFYSQNVQRENIESCKEKH